MSFIGTWQATGIAPIPGGSVSFADQLQITSEPAFGSRFTLLRKDVVTAQCSAVINSTFILTVTSAGAASFTCSVAAGDCSVTGATCPINCGAPGQLPALTFTLNGETLLGTGFPQPETFRRLGAMAEADATRERTFDTWRKGFQ